jgi:uncharacterized cupin superfamily protein
MSERRHPNIVNRDEVEPRDMAQGKIANRVHQLSGPAGGKQIGASLTTLAPGMRAWPFHFHCSNEEAVYVLSGTGTTRIGDARIAIRAGDWIAYPAGPQHAHQIVNDGPGGEPLVYLCVSTAHPVEVVGYPDSNKVAMRAGSSATDVWVRQIHKKGESLGYWDDEPDATT